MSKHLLCVLFSSGIIQAAEPAWKSELTNPAPGSFPALEPCTVDFQVSWKGMIDSGKLRMEFAPKGVSKPGVMVVRSSASSLGAAAKLFPYQNNFWSEIDPTTLTPRYFHSVESDDEETVTTTTRYLADRVECTEIERKIKGGAESRKDRVFRTIPAFDVFSAMLHVRSQKLDPGDRICLLVHPFDKPYLLKVRVAAREKHLERDAIKLRVGMQKIRSTTLELATYKKMKSEATLWLSDDAHRIPIEFRADVFIGDVRATLTGFKPIK